MFLRVSDVLVNQLIIELRRQDAIEKVRTFSTFDRAKYCHLANFEDFVSGLGIPGYKFYVGQSSKQLKVRSLTGPERLKVFKHINIRQLLPTHDEEEVLKIQVLWTELLNLNESFSKHPEAINEATVLAFESDARGWVRKFLEIYHRDRVTPYIHAMANHVGEFMRSHIAFYSTGIGKT